MESRFVALMFHIDTNRINARQKLEHMNLLEQWAAADVIGLDMAEVVLNEAKAGGNREQSTKARQSIYWETLATTPGERKMLVAIEGILFPDGADDQNKRNDVEIVFSAAKHDRILVTADGASRTQPGGILGNAVALKKAVGVEIMTDEEATAAVRRKIQARDARCVRRHELNGDPLPDWIGLD